MNITIVAHSNYQLVQVEGELDASSAVKLDDTLQELLAQPECHILVDFKQLEYISSPGIGVFTSRIEDCEKANIHLILFGMSEKVFSVFKILGLDQILPIVSTQKDAESLLHELQDKS